MNFYKIKLLKMNIVLTPPVLKEGEALRDLNRSQLLQIITEQDQKVNKNQESIKQKNEIIDSTYKEIKKICDQHLKPDAVKTEVETPTKKEDFVKSSK